MTSKMTGKQSRWILCLLAGLCWTWGISSFALQKTNAQRTPASTQELELRTYEVGDLVLDIKDYPHSVLLLGSPAKVSTSGAFGGGGGGISGGGGRFGGGGGGFAGGGGWMRDSRFQEGSNSASNRITINDLINVMTTTIAHDSWRDNQGTAEGHVMALGTSLVVSQLPEVHNQIEGLLNQIRRGSADRRTLTVDARWLLLDSDELSQLVLSSQSGLPQVRREKLEEFTRRPSSIRGITNCFSSQLVYLVSGTTRNIVSGFVPIVGSVETPQSTQQFAAGREPMKIQFISEGNRSVGYRPIIEKPNFGALLEIRPTLIPNTKEAVVDVKSTITVSSEQLPEVIEGRGAFSAVPEIDRVSIEVQEFSTTLRLPLEKPILVGGLTHVPPRRTVNVDAQQSSDKQLGSPGSENKQLYFILEVR